MAGDIERLIEWLIDDISCHGDRGYPVSQTLATIRDYHYGTADNTAESPAKPVWAGLEIEASDQALFSSIWDWIREREDISIGESRQWNHLTLTAILAMPEPEVQMEDGQEEAKPGTAHTVPAADPSTAQKSNLSQVSSLGAGKTTDKVYRPRIYASTDRMWESIAGHSADYKRVPRLEWAALVGIATTKGDGILQGDLCRLVGQDKRSLPRRTDSLAQKGYITKRTTLVRGVKTSKMWLRRLAPSMPADPTQTSNGGPVNVNWSREALTIDMEPVAWCNRWTGKSIDTHILAKTAIEIIKAWKIIRYDDLRRKLGIEGLKWQMKTQARLCRWMVRRGIVKYVAATLGDRLFKDCLKYNRDFTSDDWDSYLATGKVKARAKPEAEGLAPYKEKNLGTPNNNVSNDSSNDRYATARHSAQKREGITRQDSWKPEKPLPTAIMDVIRAGDTKGVPNRQIGKHTMGPPFTRYVSSISTTLATPALQPTHLTHFQVASQLHRVEKSAIYLFSLPQLADNKSPVPTTPEHIPALPEPQKPTVSDHDTEAQSRIDRGFSVPMRTDISASRLDLSMLAHVPNERRQWKSTRGSDQPVPTHRSSHLQSDVELTPEILVENDTSNLVSDPSANVRGSNASCETSAQTIKATIVDHDRPGGYKASKKSFIVTLKVSPLALSQVLGLAEGPLPPNAPDSRETNKTEDLDAESSITAAANRGAGQPNATAEVVQLDNEPEHLPTTVAPDSKRGRSKTKISKSAKNTKKGAKAGVFKCDTCGGVWKNDNGLKYHLEKSSSACNTTYVPPPPRTPHFQAKRARLPVQESPEEEPPSLDRSARPARAGRTRDAPIEPTQVTPAKVLHRNPHPTHTSALHARTTRRRGSSTKIPILLADVLLQPSASSENGSDDLSRARPRSQAHDGATCLGLIDILDSSNRSILHGERHVRHGLDRGIRPKPPVTPKTSENKGNTGLAAVIGANSPHSQLAASSKTPQSVRRRPSQSASPSLEEPRKADTHAGYTRSVVHAASSLPPAIAGLDTPNREHTNQESGSGRVLAIQAEETSTSPKFSMPTASSDQDTNGYALDSRLHRASEIILFLIRTNDGVFPGDRSAYLGFLSVWERTFPSDPPPSNNNVQVAINKLVSRKKIVKTTHAFRDAKGAFKSANVLLTRGTDPFCPAAVKVKEKIIAEHPQPYVLAAFTPSAEMFGQDQKMWKGEPIFSNRRKLENDVGVLDAPFYVNERLKRRKPKYGETDETSPSKRHRLHPAAIDPSLGMDEKGLVHSNLGPLTGGSGTQANRSLQHAAGLRVNSTCPEFTFLEPNTHLEDDDAPDYIPVAAREAYQEPGQWLVEAASLPRREYDFTEAKKILRQDNTWPSLEIGFFEQNPSFVMDGWMPNSQWFLKCGLPHSLDEMVTTESRYGDGQPASGEADFVAQINGCRRWEISPEAKNLIALGSVAPNYIFINHRMGTQIEWHVQTLLWSPENQLTFRGGLVGTNQNESDAVLDAHPAKRRKYTPRTRSRLEPSVQMDMKYRTLLPWSRAPGAETQMLEGQTLDGEDDAVVIAAFVATRTLLGGADKYIEWGLMMKLFPSRSLAFLRKFWSKTRRDRPASVKQLTERFQKRFIAAYERNEIPPLDFNDYVRYDWVSLIRWTAGLVEDSVTLPSARADLEQHYTLEDAMADVNGWQEDYYNVQSSIYNRLEAVTSKSAAVLLDEGKNSKACDPDLVKAKTWIRALCSTQQGLYTPQDTRAKMSSLTQRGEAYNNDVLERAIDTLQSQNVIARTRRRRYENRSYRLSEWYLPRLAKQSHEQKFVDAAAFKAQLDEKFRRNAEVRIPYVIRDGEVMAMVNLQAHGRVTVSPVDMPQIPLGFKPGVYESRKFPKTFYNFGLQITPTSTYAYDDEIHILQEAHANPPASQNLEGALPLWSDFFGALKVDRWRQVLGAVTFAIAMRGPLDLGGVVSTLKPNLEDFEVQLVIEWGLRHGVLKRATSQGASYTTAEWWWLVVGRQGSLMQNGVAA